MKKLFFVLFLAATILACEQEKPLSPSATVNLKLNALYKGAPFVIGNAYDYPGGKKIKFDEFNFFIANVTLLEADTDDELDLLEVGLADFSQNIDPADVRPVTYSVRSVPAVKYKGLRISFGVPSRFNRAAILNFGAGHPVRQAYDTHFWKDSFFFMKLKGTYDLNGDGEFGNLPEDHPFEHFPMRNANFTTMTLLRNFTIQDGKPFDLNLLVDVMQLYIDLSNGKPLDLEDREHLSTYNPENRDLSAFFMGNFKQAVTVQ